MKKIILLCFLVVLLLAGCKQEQEETQPPLSATDIVQAIAENMTQPIDGG